MTSSKMTNISASLMLLYLTFMYSTGQTLKGHPYRETGAQLNYDPIIIIHCLELGPMSNYNVCNLNRFK